MSEKPPSACKECSMRPGSVLALVALLAAGVTAHADECCLPRSGSPFLPMSYADRGWPNCVPDDEELDLGIDNRPDRQSPSAGWGAFPRLPGLRGVRGLTGVIGNLLQTNPHIGATFYPDEPVSGQPTSLGMTREFFQFSAPVWSNGEDTLVVSSHVQETSVSTNAILPTTRTPFPGQLWNIWLGVNYFHTFDNGVTGAMIVEAGSASDKPFSASRNDSAAGTGLIIIPAGDRDAWILGLQASTNSQVLYNIPIPGAAYLYNPNDDFQAIIGLPYSAINYYPAKGFQLQLLYMFYTTVHARAIYRPTNDWQAYVGFDWANENYALASRQASDERFFYYEKRLLAGWQWFWSKHFAVELVGGYAFNRYFVENNGFSFSLSGFNRVDVGSGPFATLQFDYRF
jgi:hypothetical protein